MQLAAPGYDVAGALGDDRKVAVGGVLRAVGDALTYVYDLGDWWEHAVECVAVGAEASAAARPAAAAVERMRGPMGGELLERMA